VGLVDWSVLAASLPAVLFVAALLAMIRTVRSTTVLSSVVVPERDAPPTVTALTPACDEEGAVEATVRSFLAQSGVTLDVVAIDDRSRDRTGAILDALAAEDGRVTVLHVRELPEGWLGKVHALEVGSRHATGDWLFLADADVRLSPEAIARAVAYAEQRGADVVTAYPQIEPAGLLADVTWSFIGCMAGIGLAPWRLRDPESKHAIAIGAFILVRRSAFATTPGFSYIRLEVADDMGVAILMKDHGFHCDAVNGRGDVRLRWYDDFREMVVRSQKNFYGIMSRFSLARGLSIALLLAWVGLTPALLAAPVTAQAVLLAPALGTTAMVATSLLHAHWAARPLAPALIAPLGALLLAFIVLRSALVGARLGGIQWRGVLYDADLLRDAQRFRM